jgi:hypothetical protein
MERSGQFHTPLALTLSLLMLHICGVSKKFGEWYQKTNKTEDTNKLTLLAFKIIAILHNTRLATFIKLLETVSKGLFRNRSQNSCHTFMDCRRTAGPSMTSSLNIGFSRRVLIHIVNYVEERHVALVAVAIICFRFLEVFPLQSK